MNWIAGAQELLLPAIRALRMLLEGIGALWIVVGLIFAMAELFSVHASFRLASFTQVRLTFSRYLSLALEFQLASDILSTSITPTWDEIGKLAATAVIRTALNFFLSREKREADDNQIRNEPEALGAPYPREIRA
jgi:uncharacterized membrane protein